MVGALGDKPDLKPFLHYTCSYLGAGGPLFERGRRFKSYHLDHIVNKEVTPILA